MLLIILVRSDLHWLIILIRGKLSFPWVAGSHTIADLHTEPDKKAVLGRKVGVVAHLAFDNQFESGAQKDVLEQVELGPYGRKVGLVGFGTDLFSQKDELAGYQVVLEQPRVVLAEQMVERAGWLVDLEVGRRVQKDD